MEPEQIDFSQMTEVRLENIKPDTLVLAEQIKIHGSNNVFGQINAPLTEELIQRLTNANIEEVYVKRPEGVSEEVEERATEVNDAVIQTQEVIKNVAELKTDMRVKENLRSAMTALHNLKKRGSFEFLDSMVSKIRDDVNAILSGFFPAALEGLLTLENQQPGTTLHSYDVSIFAGILAEELGLSQRMITMAKEAGLLHDIGKILIPPDIINKKGALTNEEFETIKAHTLFGTQYLSDNCPVTDPVIFGAGAHHEFFTLRHLKSYGALTSFANESNLNIPFRDIETAWEITNILSIADVSRALSEPSPYHERRNPLEVLMIMVDDMKSGKFDPEMFRVWHRSFSEQHKNQFFTKGMMISLSSFPFQIAKQIKERLALPQHEWKLSYDECEKLEIVENIEYTGVNQMELKQSNGMTLYDLQKRQVGGLSSEMRKHPITLTSIRDIDKAIANQKHGIRFSVKDKDGNPMHIYPKKIDYKLAVLRLQDETKITARFLKLNEPIKRITKANSMMAMAGDTKPLGYDPIHKHLVETTKARSFNLGSYIAMPDENFMKSIKTDRGKAPHFFV